MARFRLHTKFLVLVLGSLIAVLGALSYLIVQREASLLTQKGIEKQHALASAIVANLRDNMIEGRPRRTLDLMQHLRGTFGLVTLEVLRKDGTPAFGSTGHAVVLPQLAQVFAKGTEDDFPETGDPPVYTILVPLKNEPLCTTCHKQNDRILGVVMVSNSMEDTIGEMVRSKRDLTALFLFIIAIIGGLLYVVIRKVVLQPLMTLHRGAELIGRNDLAHRIDLSTRDELQDLAHAFNDMAGHLEKSHTDLEERIRSRTAALHSAADDALDKADRLFEYSRNMATISRLSTKVFNVELSQDDLLDRFLHGITRGLGYKQAMLCLVDRKRVWLDIKRDTGIADVIHLSSQSLLSNDPFVKMVRTGKIAAIEKMDDAHIDLRSTVSGPPRAFYVIPILSHSHAKPCWQITSCIKTDCPARSNQDTACWLLEHTLCGNPLVQSHENKLTNCVNCRVFPIFGALIVAVEPHKKPMRGKSVNVLRILAAEMAAALENHRLHAKNQQMVRELLELHRVTAAALSDLSLTKALDVFTDSALKFSGLDACTFWLVSPDGGELVRRAGGCIDGDEGDRDLCPDRLPMNEGLIGRALGQQNNFVIDYDVAHHDTTALGTVAAGHGLQSVLAIPLKSENRPLGVFSVHKRSTMPFFETEIAAFMLLASQAAMAINVCILNDELKTQNLELARHTNLLSGILTSMSSGVMLLDKNGTVMLVNETGASLLQSRREDLIDRRLAEIFPETGAFVQSDTGPHQEFDLTLPDGLTVPIGFSSTSYHGGAGEQEGVIVVFQDLSEIKTLQTELLNKERFAAMGRVVAGVAHEIRNPLFGISSISQIFERELTNPAHRELVRALLSETKRMNQLVEDLLIYSRPMKLNLEWCDLIGLWREVISIHRDELERKGIGIDGDLELDHRKAYLDAHQVRQLFLNLLRNSIDATPAGGKITIRVLLEDAYIVFKVIDTGVGIPAANQDRVFDLFFTTKPKGTGLGLGICKKIAQDHGGDITVDSTEGTGTAVTVKFPYRGAMEKAGAAN